MKLLVVGGFLGAGKTTLINEIIVYMQAEKIKVAVIENEVGSVAIDDRILKSANVDVITISGGCVCCQVTGNLISGLSKIKEEINPEWCIVELSGVAIPSKVIDNISNYYKNDLEIVLVTAVDGRRWDKLNKANVPGIKAQLDYADMIIITKCDTLKELPVIDRSKIEVPVLYSREKLWKEIKRTIEESKGNREKIKCASNDIYNIDGNVISKTVKYFGDFTSDDIISKMRIKIYERSKGIIVDGIVPGHIKAIASFSGGYITASMTDENEINFNIIGDLSQAVKGYSLTINTITTKLIE